MRTQVAQTHVAREGCNVIYAPISGLPQDGGGGGGGAGNPRELDFVKCTWVGILISTTVGNLTRPPSSKVERTWE